MRILKSKFIRKVGILGFSLTITVVSILVINTKFNLLSHVGGYLAGSPLFVDNKFCDDPTKSEQSSNCISFIPDVLAATPTPASPYQTVTGDVNISGNIQISGGDRKISLGGIGTADSGIYFNSISDQSYFIGRDSTAWGSGQPIVASSWFGWNFKVGGANRFKIGADGNVTTEGPITFKGTDLQYMRFNQFVNGSNYVELWDGQTNTLWGITTWASSKELKNNITDLDIDTSKLYELKPYSYNYKTDPESTPKTFGLMAEDVAKIIPELVAYDSVGKPHHVKLDIMSVLLLKEMQKQKKQFDFQQQEIDLLKQEIQELKNK